MISESVCVVSTVVVMGCAVEASAKSRLQPCIACACMWEYILRSLCACVLAVSLATCSCRAHMPVPLLQPFQQYLQHTYTHNIARTKMLYILSLASISPLLVAFATYVVKFYIPRETCFSVAMHAYYYVHLCFEQNGHMFLCLLSSPNGVVLLQEL